MNIKTDKEAFEFAVNKLTEQGCKSLHIVNDGTCAYRGYTEKLTKEVKNEAINIYKLSDNFLDEPEVDETFWDIYEQLLGQYSYDAKCAVGHLIDDKFYDSIIEETDITNPGVAESVGKSNPEWRITSESRMMLSLMQSIHDRHDVGKWKSMFSQFSFDDNGNFMEYKGGAV